MSLEEDPRFLAMSPREQASMRALYGDTGRGRKYNPHDRSLFPGGWRTLDDNTFGAMREYYTKGKTPPPPKPQYAGEAKIVRKEMLALPAGPKLLAITAKASC